MAVAEKVVERAAPQRIGVLMRALHVLARRFPAPRHVMRNQAPLVSVTFDDIPVSAWEVGAAMLEARGMRGTFYVATSLFGTPGEHWTHADRRAVADLHARGHEIALHSHRHRVIWGPSPAAFRDDMAESLRAFAEIVPGLAPRNFAYPFGIAGVVQKGVLARTVRSSRTTDFGINSGSIDPQFLRTVMLDWSFRDPAEIAPLLACTVRERGWTILTTHDVAGAPSPYGCTPALLGAVLDAVAAAGVEVLTVDAALDRIGL